MKKIIILSYIFIFFFGLMPAFAQQEVKEEFPGMEIIQVGGQRIYIPKGTKTRKVGAQLVIEDNYDYVAQRFDALEERLSGLEKKNDEFRQELNELREMVKDKMLEHPAL